MPSDEDTPPIGANITTVLNDDCLLEIFRYLDMKTLIVVDQVCRKFDEIAQLLYRQYHHYEIHIRTEGNLSGDILQRIGPHLNSLLFACGYLIVPTTIIRHIAKNCTGLRRLKLQYLTLGDVDLSLLEDIFLELTHLDITCCRVSQIHMPLPFVLNAPKLVYLKLHFFENKCEDSFLSLVHDNPNVVIEKYPHSQLSELNVIHA